MSRRTETLAKIGLFRSVDAAKIEILDTQCSWRRASRNQWIMEYQDASSDVFFIVSGTVRVKLQSVSGREVRQSARGQPRRPSHVDEHSGDRQLAAAFDAGVEAQCARTEVWSGRHQRHDRDVDRRPQLTGQPNIGRGCDALQST